ncbi:lauroyl acyltransferase [Candidatus Kirkpatrickella diaphorinae]|uniref:Lauroyl acyltransferase n=1 Tax=Candidatus Kirkpatrickella diaphorinae TaxID=2984322 RepID=A0ABY6GKJ6_9PROT|nr:lauroyl acyltransferase [Candidatus Kirkpatrickella diaphorinae]UYH52061.1 lauroyl acyltransferase [Candidatus Kirkpatrickella diaphorinae]
MASRWKRVGHRLEYMLARALLYGFSRMAPQKASRLGAAIARMIGKWAPVSRIADINLRLMLPHLSAAERARLVRNSWGHIGATLAEFPHLSHLEKDKASDPGWRIEGEDHLLALRDHDVPIIFFSGHIGNWEMLPPIVASYGLAFAPFYREASNPLINRLIAALRQKAAGQAVPMFPKGARGARAAMAHLKNRGRLGVLGDQKMNDGIVATLFGEEAMTASATASFALKYQCIIVPGVMRRVGPARLHLRVEKPFTPVATGDRQKDVEMLTQQLNDQLEAWIRETPDQWLLLHRRWPRHFYALPVKPRA